MHTRFIQCFLSSRGISNVPLISVLICAGNPSRFHYAPCVRKNQMKICDYVQLPRKMIHNVSKMKPLKFVKNPQKNI